MLQVNTTANLDNGMSIDTGMVVSLTPQIEQARPNAAGDKVIVPLSISCYLSEATLNNRVYQPLVPIKDGSESVPSRSLFTMNIEYTNAEWDSQTDVNKGSMEDRLLVALEAWNAPWAGNIVKLP